MNERIIFHVDVNNAFLSWSAIYLLKNGYKTDIRNIPAVIGGYESKRHGIVLAKSMVAKKYKIVTAETLYSAREKCPSVKIFSPNHEWYYEQSQLFHNYLKQFSPIVEKYSVDEAYIDLSGTKYVYNDYLDLAYKIKNEIKDKFGFTVNVGIGNNMLCAKMASDFEKPDKVHTLFMEEVKQKMWPLPIEDLFMVGKITSKQLRNLNINTIGDLANTDISILKKHFKNQAQFLKDSANGIDESKVQRAITKAPSISITETLLTDVSDKEILKKVLFRQVNEVSRQLRNKKKYCDVVAVLYKNSNFESYSKQVKLKNPTDKTEEIYNTIENLLNFSFRGDDIRLIGVRLANLSDDRKCQISLFDQNIDEDDNNDVQKVMDNINNKFGTNLIFPASMKKKQKNVKKHLHNKGLL